MHDSIHQNGARRAHLSRDVQLHPLDVLVVYRDNEFLAGSVPKIISDLETEGYRVKPVVFPQGTPEDSIAASLQRTSRFLLDSIVISDETVKRIWPSSAAPRGNLLGCLDECFNASVKSAVFNTLKIDPLMAQYHVDCETTKTVMTKLLSASLEKAKSDDRYPSRIVILTQALWEHAPFNSLVSDRGLVHSDERHAFLDRLGRNVAQWVRGAGYRRRNPVSVIEEPSELYLLDIEPEQIVWFIGDRHLLSRQQLLSKIQLDQIDSSRFSEESVDTNHDDELSLGRDRDSETAEAEDSPWIEQGLSALRPRKRGRDSDERGYRAALRARLREEAQLERELSAIERNEGHRSMQLAGILSALGIEPESEVDPRLEPAHVRRPHLPLPIPNFVSCLVERGMLPENAWGVLDEAQLQVRADLIALVHLAESRIVTRPSNGQRLNGAH